MSCTDCAFKVGQVGAIVVIEVYTKDENGVDQIFDVSPATTLEVVVKKPDGATQTFPAVFAAVADGGTGDGTDGKIKFTTTQASDFSVAGDYLAEPNIVEPNTGFSGRTQRFSFPVEDVLS